MALQGTLKDFGISDIFQLLQQQQKAGILVMRDKETEVKILFDTGKIVGAESTGTRQQKEPLGVLLVRGSLITQAQLDAALAVQQKTLKKLGDLLIDDKAISKEDLKSFLALQTRETLNRILRWKTGEYEFIPQPVKYDSDVATPMSPEHVLMDGFRMLDEWPGVQKKIHGLESIPAIPKGVEANVVKKARPKPGHEGDEEEEDDKDKDDDGDDDLDAAFAAFEDDAPKKEKAKSTKIKLSGTQTVVFDLIDGSRTIQDIVDRSLLGEFNTCNALAGLIDKGAAAIVGRKRVVDDGRIPVVERPRGEGLQLAIAAFFALAVIVVSLAALLVLGLGRRSALSVRATAVPETGTALDAIATHRAQAATQAGGVFFLTHGRWPKDLAELIVAGLLTDDDLKSPGGQTLVYLPPTSADPNGRVVASVGGN